MLADYLGKAVPDSIKQQQERSAVMKKIRLLLAFGMLVAVLAGCASEGPTQAEIEAAMPALKPGYGRIYFLRAPAFIGAPIQPEILLNNQAVGRSQPRGFFFVDRPAGAYQAKTSTSVTTALDFSLFAGEVKYIRTEVNVALLGVMPGSVSFSLMDQSAAEPELRELNYTGKAVKVEPKLQPKQEAMPTMQPAAIPESVPTPALTPTPAE